VQVIDLQGVRLVKVTREAHLLEIGRAGAGFQFLVLAIATIFRPGGLLIAENLCPRQQWLVLQRRHPRPRLSDAGRSFWILASRWRRLA
jgi:hypothetical protein